MCGGIVKTLGSNIPALRVATIFVSFLFIPSFVYGVVGVWTIFYAVVIAYFFRRRLIGIINGYTPLEDQHEKVRYIRMHVPLLVFECVVLTVLPQLFCLIFDGINVLNFGYDAGFYKDFAEFLYEADAFAGLNKGDQIVVTAVFTIPVFCFLLFVESIATLTKITNTYARESTKKTMGASYPKKIYLYNWYDFLGYMSGFLAVMILMSPYFFDEFLSISETSRVSLGGVRLIVANVLPYLSIICAAIAYQTIHLTIASSSNSKEKMSEFLEKHQGKTRRKR